jgi:hypothetical protein
MFVDPSAPGSHSRTAQPPGRLRSTGVIRSLHSAWHLTQWHSSLNVTLTGAAETAPQATNASNEDANNSDDRICVMAVFLLSAAGALGRQLERRKRLRPVRCAVADLGRSGELPISVAALYRRHFQLVPRANPLAGQRVAEAEGIKLERHAVGMVG